MLTEERLKAIEDRARHDASDDRLASFRRQHERHGGPDIADLRELVVAAREAVPALVAEVRRLRSEVVRIENVVRSVANGLDGWEDEAKAPAAALEADLGSAVANLLSCDEGR